MYHAAAFPLKSRKHESDCEKKTPIGFIGVTIFFKDANRSYRAYATERVSRTTVILICPGY